ncbi:monovalent cation/H(+) antiporter subunit G [Nakamurella flava]|uniref:Monovalent cation/H(+) antiporter subunit G n=1 Tax=Nakamurella flava TaxID=2576308 RepID=A0A4U6Q8L0_9ACTN|nr:monovalent cation/H(+) antiporter subunit G [Nakamurella flava]TKV56106.1 monovalent cation/H(+) antiporter subunit G [Nakamurella flava]
MTVVDWIASAALILGASLSLFAGLAVLRFPDTMARIHAATKPQVLGIMLLMLGVGLRLQTPGVIGLLLLIVILQFVTAPVSAHLTVRVAYRNAEQDDEDQSVTPEDRAHLDERLPASDDGPQQMGQATADESDRPAGRG